MKSQKPAPDHFSNDPDRKERVLKALRNLGLNVDEPSPNLSSDDEAQSVFDRIVGNK